MEFQEPERFYSFDTLRKTNVKVRIAFLTSFLCLTLSVLYFAKYGIDVKKSVNTTIAPQLAFYCGINSLEMRDSPAQVVRKLKDLIVENEGIFSKISGYEKVFAQNGQPTPVIQLTLKAYHEEHSSIPETVCGYPVRITYLSN